MPPHNSPKRRQSTAPPAEGALLVSLLAESRDPLCMVNGDGRLLWCNPSFRNILPSAQKLSDFLPPTSVKQLLSTDQFATISTTIENQSGNSAAQLALVLNVSSGDPGSEVYLVSLRAMSAPIPNVSNDEEFLITVTHDLKTPLGAIFGYADVLLDTPSGIGLTPQQRDIVARMRATAARAVEFVRNYQLFAALQQDQSTRAPGQVPPTDLNELVQSVIDSTWRDDTASPELRLQLCESPCQVPIERVHLERVVANLFTNALKYTPSNGEIFIRTWCEHAKMYLAIRNTGAPIPAAELSFIFDRFTRASNAREMSGSGLGLYIVRYILDRVGGSISVTSTASVGTTFTVILPGLANG